MLRFIAALPRASAYIEAVTEDEQVAEALANEPDPVDTKPRRRMSEYDATVETLSLLVDRVAELIATVAASRGIKPRRIPPAPRPVTALERVRQRHRKEQHVSLVSRLLPHKARQAEPAPAPRPAAPPRRGPLPPPPSKQPPPRTNRSGWSS